MVELRGVTAKTSDRGARLILQIVLSIFHLLFGDCNNEGFMWQIFHVRPGEMTLSGIDSVEQLFQVVLNQQECLNPMNDKKRDMKTIRFSCIGFMKLANPFEVSM